MLKILTKTFMILTLSLYAGSMVAATQDKTSGKEFKDSDFTIDQLNDKIVYATLDNFKVTGADIKAEYAKADERTRRETIGLPEEFIYYALVGSMIEEKAFKKIIQNSKITNESEIKAQIEKQKQAMLSEELTKRYVNRNLTEEYIQKVYKDLRIQFNKNKISGEKEVQIASIVVSTEIDAKKTIAKLNEGVNFSKLCNEVSIDPKTSKNGGKIPQYIRNSPNLPKDIANSIFSLSRIGDHSKTPLKVGEDYCVFKLLDKRPVIFPTLDSQRKNITARAKLSLTKKYHDQVKKGAKFLKPDGKTTANIEKEVTQILKDTQEKFARIMREAKTTK